MSEAYRRWWHRNKVRLLQKKKDNYDPVKRHEQYLRYREKHPEKYAESTRKSVAKWRQKRRMGTWAQLAL